MNDKIIITSKDVNESEGSVTATTARIQPIPALWRILSVFLIFFPPLLFPLVIAGLLRARHRNLPVCYAHVLHYCWILLASGILWTFVFLGLALWTPSNLLCQGKDSSPLYLHSFPILPSMTTLSGRDIAQQLSPLVVLVHQANYAVIPSNNGTRQSCGAGAFAYAGRDGCLVVTSRHVIDALSRAPILGKLVGVTLQDGQQARATVVGVHRTLDIALVWVPREASNSNFAQPLRSFSTIEVGEQVFVIGHPEGLEFSLSGGLVAQKRGDDLIQMSAPVSPGNSGGPVYDTQGNLVAIVQSVIDKTKSPNAENLNFAVRVDDLLTADAWTLLKDGRLAIAAFVAMNQKTDGK